MLLNILLEQTHTCLCKAATLSAVLDIQEHGTHRENGQLLASIFLVPLIQMSQVLLESFAVHAKLDWSNCSQHSEGYLNSLALCTCSWGAVLTAVVATVVGGGGGEVERGSEVGSEAQNKMDLQNFQGRLQKCLRSN